MDYNNIIFILDILTVLVKTSVKHRNDYHEILLKHDVNSRIYFYYNYFTSKVHILATTRTETKHTGTLHESIASSKIYLLGHFIKKIVFYSNIHIIELYQEIKLILKISYATYKKN